MAIWEDSDQSVHWDSGHKDIIRCPRCGINIFTDEKLGKNVCKKCGGVYDPDTMEFSYSFDRRDNGPAGDLERNKREFTCGQCSASVISGEGGKLRFCPFCGSDNIVESALTREFRPDVYIPFKVTREEAVRELKAFAEGKAFVPYTYKTDATMSKVTGIYVPFWLIDCDTHLDVEGFGTRDKEPDRGEGRNVKIQYDYRVAGLPFDGSKTVSDRLMEAIEPYDYSELKSFDDECLNGYFAERFDESPLDMSEKIMLRLYKYSDRFAEHLAEQYKDFEVRKNDSVTDNIKQRYALLPMWFLNYEYEGIKYRFAVNGQTGEVDGEMPVSSARSTIRKLPMRMLFVLPFAAIVTGLIIAIVFFRDSFTGGIEWLLKYGFFIVLLILSFGVYSAGRYGLGFSWERRERRKDIAEGLGDRFMELPDVADRVINSVDNELHRFMDEIPDVLSYYEPISGAKPNITESAPKTDVIEASHKDDR